MSGIAVTTKETKTLWWWQWLCLINSSISAWCPRANHCLTGIVLGVRRTKNIPQYQYYPIPVNIAQYPITQYQYRSKPSNEIQIFVIFPTLSDTYFVLSIHVSGWCVCQSKESMLRVMQAVDRANGFAYSGSETDDTRLSFCLLYTSPSPRD